MTTKHTPAPWRRADSDYYFNVLLGKDGVIKLEKPLNRNQLLQNQANAKLIAAAPDLLDALMDIVEKWDEETSYFDSIGLTSNYKDEIEQASAAIAKATGEYDE